MKRLASVLVAILAFAVVKADFPVKVVKNGNALTIIAPFGAGMKDTTLTVGSGGMVDIRVPYNPKEGGMFFAVGEAFIEKLKKDGFKLYGYRWEAAKPSYGAVYYVVAFNAGKKKIATLFPVEFSIFSIAGRTEDGGSVSNGFVRFNDTIISKMEQWEFK